MAPSHLQSGKVALSLSGGKESPLMKPRPTNGRRVASSDVREYKIGIRGKDKVALSHLQNSAPFLIKNSNNLKKVF